MLHIDNSVRSNRVVAEEWSVACECGKGWIYNASLYKSMFGDSSSTTCALHTAATRDQHVFFTEVLITGIMSEAHLIYAMLHHLEYARKHEALSSKLIQNAIDALSSAYKLDMSDASLREKDPLRKLPLPEVYKTGCKKLLADKPKEASASSAADDAELDKFMMRLKSMTAF